MRSIQNTRVVVIGGAGFLGSHLVDHLIEDRHCEVVVLDNLITGVKKFVSPDLLRGRSLFYAIRYWDFFIAVITYYSIF